MAATSAMTKYGLLSWGEFISLGAKLVKLPLLLSLQVFRMLLWERPTQGLVKTATVSGVRELTASATVPQLQYLLGTTSSVYYAWSKRHGLAPTVEEFVDESALYWIGPKRSHKVVLYLHGGGFFAPVQDFALSFWNHIREGLKLQGVDVGFAVLRYTLLPDGTFPTQLRQLAVAVDHLIATGTHPSNLQIVGDSAGANIILQLLSQLLHPLDKIGPLSRFEAPFGGIYLMSPWVTFESTSESFNQPGAVDLYDAHTLAEWTKAYIRTIPDSRRQYVEPLAASDAWFKGVSKFANRILVSAGGAERLKDDIVQFAKAKISKEDVNLQIEIQEDGVHDDPYYDFVVTDSPASVGGLSPIIVDWLKEGFEGHRP